MAFKKAIGQTMRELKREVNKYRLSETEMKVQEATSNEPWGPHGSTLMMIADASFNSSDVPIIVSTLDRRLADVGKDWRHVYKAMIVMEFLVANGSMEVVEEISRRVSILVPLTEFQYVEDGGKDQGINVRKKAETLICLLSDRELLMDIRRKALTNKNKYQGVGSDSANSPSENAQDDDDWQNPMQGWPQQQPSSQRGGLGQKHQQQPYSGRPPPPSYEEALRTSVPYDEETYKRLNSKRNIQDNHNTQPQGMIQNEGLSSSNFQQPTTSSSRFDSSFLLLEDHKQKATLNEEQQRPSFDFEDFDPRDPSCIGCGESSNYGPSIFDLQPNPESSTIPPASARLPSLQGSNDKLLNK